MNPNSRRSRFSLSRGIRMLSSFSGRTLVALLVLHGIAVLDFGSRASAGFWPTLSGPNSCGAAQDVGGSDAGNEQPVVWPPAARNLAQLHMIAQARGAESGGGAGSPTSTSTTGSGPAPAIGVMTCNFMAAHPSSRLCINEFRSGSSLLTVSIFEPPRVV